MVKWIFFYLIWRFYKLMKRKSIWNLFICIFNFSTVTWFDDIQKKKWVDFFRIILYTIQIENSELKNFRFRFVASQFGGQLVLRGVPLQDRRKSDVSDHMRGSWTVWNGNSVLPSRVTGIYSVPRPVRVLRRTIYLHATKNGYDIIV